MTILKGISLNDFFQSCWKIILVNCIKNKHLLSYHISVLFRFISFDLTILLSCGRFAQLTGQLTSEGYLLSLKYNVLNRVVINVIANMYQFWAASLKHSENRSYFELKALPAVLENKAFYSNLKKANRHELRTNVTWVPTKM